MSSKVLGNIFCVFEENEMLYFIDLIMSNRRIDWDIVGGLISNSTAATPIKTDPSNNEQSKRKSIQSI